MIRDSLRLDFLPKFLLEDARISPGGCLRSLKDPALPLNSPILGDFELLEGN